MTKIQAVNKALSIMHLAGYTLDSPAYTALVKEKASLEKSIIICYL